ncbi:hypothetical protein ACH3XX_42435 [Streptomyces scabiei]|uniref:hypothetical protein n=1 Tax=Streptomyces scabiei TaxID=1930 RepID=UPI001B319B74|nr:MULTISPECIES: hypothetical protein [Streptomyces]MBP5915863.1 hypothetical protein [Streptomyces sp. LBUM 1486]MDX2626480.1 hypothetical protein [Streptomyces scabiei]MDX3028596.1 hypothetical protein [Streptomyces scabiei]MDX3168289.1 hypothetical protein [Streptomyces scabiei]MDX3207334.1 hypothetical protein [Streptomyces scabiei]
MAVLTAQAMPLGGLQPTYANAAGGGDQAPVGEKLVLHVRNDDASSKTVTVVTPGTVGGLAIADATQTIPAGADAFIPLKSTYRDPATGRAAITYSAATSVTVAVLQLP